MYYLRRNCFKSIVRYVVFMLTVVGVLFCAQHARAQTSANLLTDPGFESNALVSYTTVLTGTEDAWGDENSAIVGTTGAINPFGTLMLEMSSTQAAQTGTQTIQLVAVPIAFEFDIDAGFATVDMSGFLNVAANAPNARGSVIIEFLNAGAASLGFLATSSDSLGPNGLDVDPLTWENVLVDDAVVPPLTRFLRAQFAYNNVSLAGNPGFVDNADLRITVPEPSSAILVVMGLLGLVGCRRSRVRMISK